MKKLKLPNGFGSISYYGEHRRRPYVAKKYIDGKQKPIGYYATYEDALAYLIAYNKNPSLFNPSEITFGEIFKLWSAEHFPKIAKTTAANYNAAYKHCELLVYQFKDKRPASSNPCHEPCKNRLRQPEEMPSADAQPLHIRCQIRDYTCQRRYKPVH